jgi:DNA polymerase-3 subunit alpha
MHKPKEYVKRAKELGMQSLALTDTNALYGAIEFYQAAKSEGIKPIIGVELHFEAFVLESEASFEMVLLAENNIGYRNLLNLVSAAQLATETGQIKATFKQLKEFSEGLILLTGGFEGEFAQILLQDPSKANQFLQKLLQIFPSENLFIELQSRPNDSVKTRILQESAKIAAQENLQIVATNACRYLKPENKQAHDILVCIGEGKTVHDQNRKRFSDDLSFLSQEEMKKHFADYPQAVQNSLKIAERCAVEIEFDKFLIPKFDCPQGFDSAEYLRHLCIEGLKKRYQGQISEEAMKRLDYELETVHKMGFDTYFLIVADFVNFAKDKGIVVGPGRGSAAGSIIAYALRITELDPLKYGLIFERFLNPERISMPDIDIDFEDERRDEVLYYVIEKYGRNSVAQIITFGTMAAKAAIRDVGRALGYPYIEVDKIAKLVPPPVLGRYSPLKQYTQEDPELSALYKSDPRAAVLLDSAIELEGSVRHIGTHACAVIIADGNLTDHTPLQKPAGESQGIVTQFSMNPLESLGLLKMDFLGLKNLTLIRKAQELIEKRHGVKIDPDNLNLEDKDSFELLQRGETTGVFQLESAGMKRYLRDLRPNALADIIAMNALYRPGPMQYIPQYIRGKHDPKSVSYLDQSFEEILSETYGVAVYQEQVLLIAQMFAGFSLGQADILRKAVGKKIPALLAEQRELFVEGAIAKGHSQKFAEKVFDEVVEPFSGYGFNKAHAACYGYIAYITAFLKAHYPAEFMATLMTGDQDNTDRIVLEINEARSMEIEVLPPSINESFTDFTVVDESKIRFGLAAIKGIGAATIEEIIKVRLEGGDFKNLQDFAKRVPYKLLNKKVLEALSLSGAMDELADRRKIAANCAVISDFAKTFQTKNSAMQTDIFSLGEAVSEEGELKLQEFPPVSFLEQLEYEKEYLGLYVSGHPLSGLSKFFERLYTPIAKITPKFVNKPIKVIGLIKDLRKIMTKKGDYMSYFKVEDTSSRIEAIAFSEVFRKYGENLNLGNLVVLTGKIVQRKDILQLVCEKIVTRNIEEMIGEAKKSNVYNPKEKIVINDLPEFAVEEKNLEKTPAVPKEPRVFYVQIPLGTPLATLEKIKALLVKYPGESAVELMIETKDGVKQVKAPFGIKYSTKLKEKVAEILGG